jgi:hypothetical protein
VQFATYKFSPSEIPDQIASVEEYGGWWVRFGDDVLVYTANEKWNAVTSRIKSSDRLTRQEIGTVPKLNMHLVVQKGRTFQQENPDVRLIIDKGRFLVVDIHRSIAEKLSGRKDPCFQIEPLKGNTTVFKTVARESVARTFDTRIASIVASLDQTVYNAVIDHIVSHPTRFSTSSDYTEVANWAKHALEGLGCTTASVPVSIGSSGQSNNIIAVKAGAGGAGRGNCLIVGHLDSINIPGGTDASAPGADDNASGATGVMVMASVLAAHRFKHDLTFVLFGGEEQGLHGSKQYVAGLSDEQRKRVVAVLNMDMIGSRNTPSPTVLLEGASLSQTLIDSLSAAAATYTALNIQTSLNPFASDHVPFIEARIPAVLTIEGADNANDAIHTGNDTLDLVDTAFAIEILRMNLGFVIEQAVLDERPATGFCCLDQTDIGSFKSETLRVLESNYQSLFAQYTRLMREGRLDDRDYANWQAARAMHDMLVTTHTTLSTGR